MAFTSRQKARPHVPGAIQRENERAIERAGEVGARGVTQVMLEAMEGHASPQQAPQALRHPQFSRKRASRARFLIEVRPGGEKVEAEPLLAKPRLSGAAGQPHPANVGR